MIETLVRDAPTAREAAPMLLDVLRDRWPAQAEWIEDVYSEVLKDLRQDRISDDHEMVVWLIEALTKALGEVAPEGYVLQCVGSAYQYVPEGRLETDSAGVTCRYTPIEKLEPGDVVIIGWRTTVERIERREGEARVIWTNGHVDQWTPLGTEMPVEVAP